MTAFAAVLAVQFIVLHRLDGGEVSINPHNVASLHAAARDGQNKLYPNSAHCSVFTIDNKIVGVLEHCDLVKRLIDEAVK